MTHYQTLISEAVGSNDPALLALVEEFMRMDRSGLDGLSPEQFAAEARMAHQDVIGLHSAGELQNICAAYRIPVPTFATA